jgi:high-affinity iron transporter
MSVDPSIRRRTGIAYGVAVVSVALIAGTVAWQRVMSLPDPLARSTTAAAAIDVGILVFREGLECVLVLTAITASMVGDASAYRRPVAAGAAIAFLASLATWKAAVSVIDDLGQSVSALQLQAATGLLAIIVLLVIMNWFFHKMYWTGWISLHTERKRRLVDSPGGGTPSRARLVWGLALLGFTSLYREGFEVVLFLQSYRLKLGSAPIGWGVLSGLALTAIVGWLAFFGHRHLPYKRMLVVTGVMLGCVLVVMVGEQAQEMQLAQWLPTTPIPWLTGAIPSWAGLWLSVFPTVETLAAQALAVLLVLGSYVVAGTRSKRRARAGSPPAGLAEPGDVSPAAMGR